MSRSPMTTRTTALLLVGLAACASRQADKAPPASPAAEEPAGYAQPQPGYPAQPPAAPYGDEADRSSSAPPPPEPSPSGGAPPPPATRPYAAPPNRAVALAQAANEIEASQRELDVAGGDCRNACRALGSMDRAAGRLCGLAQSNDEVRRCGDAKTRVYSARDKVRNTCGRCPDVSVERDAPIPSAR